MKIEYIPEGHATVPPRFKVPEEDKDSFSQYLESKDIDEQVICDQDIVFWDDYEDDKDIYICDNISQKKAEKLIAEFERLKSIK
jgi:hypothetical protein